MINKHHKQKLEPSLTKKHIIKTQQT